MERSGFEPVEIDPRPHQAPGRVAPVPFGTPSPSRVTPLRQHRQVLSLGWPPPRACCSPLASVTGGLDDDPAGALLVPLRGPNLDYRGNPTYDSVSDLTCDSRSLMGAAHPARPPGSCVHASAAACERSRRKRETHGRGPRRERRL